MWALRVYKVHFFDKNFTLFWKVLYPFYQKKRVFPPDFYWFLYHFLGTCRNFWTKKKFSMETSYSLPTHPAVSISYRYYHPKNDTAKKIFLSKKKKFPQIKFFFKCAEYSDYKNFSTELFFERKSLFSLNYYSFEHFIRFFFDF